jgi:hypothetical protein
MRRLADSICAAFLSICCTFVLLAQPFERRLPLPVDRHRRSGATPLRGAGSDSKPLQDSGRAPRREGFLAGDRHPPRRLSQRAPHSGDGGQACHRAGDLSPPGCIWEGYSYPNKVAQALAGDAGQQTSKKASVRRLSCLFLSFCSLTLSKATP